MLSLWGRDKLITQTNLFIDWSYQLLLVFYSQKVLAILDIFNLNICIWQHWQVTFFTKPSLFSCQPYFACLNCCIILVVVIFIFIFLRDLNLIYIFIFTTSRKKVAGCLPPPLRSRHLVSNKICNIFQLQRPAWPARHAHHKNLLGIFF